MEYRNELKYVCNTEELFLLEKRVSAVMKKDCNLGDKNTYNIRSIYFDNYCNSFMSDNEDGINERVKIRIRIYNRSPQIIKLEFKYKLNGYTKKIAAPITAEVCKKIIQGERLQLEECDNELLQMLYVYMQSELLEPKVVVEYDRAAYINEVGNVRVTFDYNVRASLHIDRFFEENMYSVPVMDNGTHILEVKYDELLPSHIKQTLDTDNLIQTSFSKYYLSRIAVL